MFEIHPENDPDLAYEPCEGKELVETFRKYARIAHLKD